MAVSLASVLSSIYLARGVPFAGSSVPNILDSSRVPQNDPEKAHLQSCATSPWLPAEGRKADDGNCVK